MFILSTKALSHTFGQAQALLRLCLLSLLLLIPDVTQAAIYSCATSNGGRIFQDRPCPIVIQQKTPVKTQRLMPFGIHESWFELPQQAQGRAYCDRRRCECGELQRSFNGSLDQALADALYIDGGWHRYETSYKLWLAAPGSSKARHDYTRQMEDAACNVMISQQLLREYAEEVTERLRQKARLAEEYGFDQPEPCQDQIREACSYLDAVELLQRIQSDARALQIPRELTDSTPALPLNR
ncbi:DUF4124 domain-containing protein [Granulosicoccus antarcticus]|uniref:DUF4124 domain-containing protein n=1 Tax=Granulosicoccus antarcticus IMCC3135 TaxID=1192854 RepID=A0A2Z2P3L2_9GAMM|nr:DUF4124 domain-containing protein [Granulosicoccus antarcticus]ASJ74384.1 hypothetical protein IMCC3135_21535 [Granulosicoccus antarcticus IMCC3135]